MSGTSFFNTIKLQGHELQKAIETAKDQDNRILMIFKLKDKPLTPVQVHQAYEAQFRRCPLTSIRMSITTLTKKGRLVKTDDMVPGNWGKPIHKWKLA